MLFGVLSGEGLLKDGEESYAVRKGDHFILPSGFGEFTLEGKMEIIVSHP
jgi:mannose-6-phosphate isomerase